MNYIFKICTYSVLAIYGWIQFCLCWGFHVTSYQPILIWLPQTKWRHSELIYGKHGAGRYPHTEKVGLYLHNPVLKLHSRICLQTFLVFDLTVNCRCSGLVFFGLVSECWQKAGPHPRAIQSRKKRGALSLMIEWLYCVPLVGTCSVSVLWTRHGGRRMAVET